MFENISNNINVYIDTMENHIHQIEYLSHKLDESKQEINKLKNENYTLENNNLDYKIKINRILNIKNGFLKLKSLEDIHNYLSSIVDFIFKLKEYDIYNINDILNYIEITNNIFSKNYNNDDINDIITNYHLGYNKKNKYTEYNYGPFFIKYFEKKEIYHDLNFKPENKKLLDCNKIKENTNFYKQKIYIKNIPIIIEYKKYEKNDFEESQLVPFFDIKKHFYIIIELLKKYNLSFSKNTKKRTQKDKKKY